MDFSRFRSTPGALGQTPPAAAGAAGDAAWYRRPVVLVAGSAAGLAVVAWAGLQLLGGPSGDVASGVPAVAAAPTAPATATSGAAPAVLTPGGSSRNIFAAFYTTASSTTAPASAPAAGVLTGGALAGSTSTTSSGPTTSRRSTSVVRVPASTGTRSTPGTTSPQGAAAPAASPAPTATPSPSSPSPSPAASPTSSPAPTATPAHLVITWTGTTSIDGVPNDTFTITGGQADAVVSVPVGSPLQETAPLLWIVDDGVADDATLTLRVGASTYALTLNTPLTLF